MATERTRTSDTDNHLLIQTLIILCFNIVYLLQMLDCGSRMVTFTFNIWGSEVMAFNFGPLPWFGIQSGLRVFGAGVPMQFLAWDVGVEKLLNHTSGVLAAVI